MIDRRSCAHNLSSYEIKAWFFFPGFNFTTKFRWSEIGFNFFIVSLQLEDLQSITESEEQSARQMEPDIRMLDKYKTELKEMDRNISLQQSKLHGVG